MKRILIASLLIFFLSSSFSSKRNDKFNFKIEWAKLNHSLWSMPYRYENKDLKSLTVKVAVGRLTDENALDLNHISLVDETKNLRISPNAVYVLKSRDRKKYLKTKAVNQNYNAFEDFTLNGIQNFQAKTFKPNILGKKKKNQVSTVKALKKVTVSSKITYYLDFPVSRDFTYGKVYYQDQPIGFAALQE